MSTQATSSPAIMAKILINSARPILLTLFMLVLAYVAFTLGYGGAAAFFGVVALGLGVILYRKIRSERVRAQFGEYRIDL